MLVSRNRRNPRLRGSQGNGLVTSVDFQPLLPGERSSGPLLERAAVLAREGYRLGALAGPLATTLRPLLRAMNSYYTNRIEGQRTRPADIERALASEFDANRAQARKQRLAVAHIEAEEELEAAAAKGTFAELYATAFVRDIHAAIHRRLPTGDRVSDTGAPVDPGALRRVRVTRQGTPPRARGARGARGCWWEWGDAVPKASGESSNRSSARRARTIGFCGYTLSSMAMAARRACIPIFLCMRLASPTGSGHRCAAWPARRRGLLRTPQQRRPASPQRFGWARSAVRGGARRIRGMASRSADPSSWLHDRATRARGAARANWPSARISRGAALAHRERELRS